MDPDSAAMGLTACGLRDAVHGEGKVDMKHYPNNELVKVAELDKVKSV